MVVTRSHFKKALSITSGAASRETWADFFSRAPVLAAARALEPVGLWTHLIAS